MFDWDDAWNASSVLRPDEYREPLRAIEGVVLGADAVEHMATQDTTPNARAPNVLRGGPSNDTIIGGAGPDNLRGGAGNDILRGRAGIDFIRGDKGNDLLDGGIGGDDLRGGIGNDKLIGGLGDDSFRGGIGNDIAKGGAGRDIFFAEPLGVDQVIDFSRTEDKLDFTESGISGFGELATITTELADRLVINTTGTSTLSLNNVKLTDLTTENTIFAIDPNGPPTIDPNGPPTDEVELGSAGQILFSENIGARFVSISEPIVLSLAGAILSTDVNDIIAYRNGDAIQPSQVTRSADGTQLLISDALDEGSNEIELYAVDSQGLQLFAREQIWAGGETLSVRVLDNTGQVVPNARVIAKLTEDQEVFMEGTTGLDGLVSFGNLPNRNILLEVLGGSNTFASLGALGGDGSLTLSLEGLQQPSPIDNNDFQSGADGWNVGTAPVTLVPHVTTAANAASLAIFGLAAASLPEQRADTMLSADFLQQAGDSFTGANAAAVLAAVDDDVDLQLSTSGEGEQKISRTFAIKPDTESVKIRYQFITSEVPGGYFGTQFNDYYRVTIRSQEGGVISESNSMNALGLGAFSSDGATAFRELTLPVKIDGDVVQIDVAVANVADGALDSRVIVDLVKEERLAIVTAELNDIDNSDLNYLSVSGANPYFGGNTNVNGTLRIEGGKDEVLQSVLLEILQGGSVVATADLAPAVKSSLLGQPLGDDGMISIDSSTLLFQLPNAAAASIVVDTDSTVSLRVKAIGASGTEAVKEIGPVEILSHYDGTNRYGSRDESQGGDDWALPSVINLAGHFAGQITVGDLSNMNGGKFTPHQTHDDGTHLDGWFNGYNARDAATAQTMIALLNDDTFGESIRTVYVTYQASPTNAFWSAIQGVTLDDGRAAGDVIRPLKGHTTHFHWTVAV